MEDPYRIQAHLDGYLRGSGREVRPVCVMKSHPRLTPMGFALSVLYLVTMYLSTTTVFGPFAAYHVEQIIAALVLLVSLPSLPNSFTLKTPQSLALIGLAAAVFMSVLMTGWAGGAVQAFQDFVPNAFAYFLVCLHCNSKRRMKFLVIVLLFVCFFVIAHGVMELRGLPPDTSKLPRDYSTAYLLGDWDAAGHLYFRLRGQNLINDPNDLGQLLVSVIPLVFIFWRQKRMASNTLLVLLPVSVLVYGAFLTHSRGCLLALLAIGVVAGRRRLGTTPSVVLAGGLFVAASKLGFTGGRAISAESGSGRMVLWAEAIGALKSHPLFGVGFERLPDYLGLTAHNSIMVCAAELGLFGLFFWSLFLFPTLRDVSTLASPSKVTEVQPSTPTEGLFPMPVRRKEEIDKAEINRLGELAILSLTGFLVTGFFLSRAFVLTLFLLGGLGEVIYEWALERGMVSPRLKMGAAWRYSGIFGISLLIGVYALLRIAL